MSNTTNADIEAILDHLVISPATIQDLSLDMVERMTNNEVDIVDPTSPFFHLLSCSSTHAAAAILKSESLSRRQYPKLAQTINDLFPHMSDGDFAGIYAAPVENHLVKFALDYNQIVKHAVLDVETGLRKVVLPGDTVFKAQSTGFVFHHPVEILVYPNNDIRAFFNTSYTTPLKQRPSNIIFTRKSYYKERAFFEMWLPCDQLDIVSESSPVTVSSRWTIEVPFTDSFYHARGFYTTDGATWNEMHVTHDPDTFDPLEPTMVLKVMGQVVVANIPDIFINEGRVGSLARLDIYTTRGKQTIDLGAVEVSDWSVVWSDRNRRHTKFIAPLQEITGRIVYSDSKSTGGRGAMTFADVRNRAIYNLYGKNGAYTDEELRAELGKLGYWVARRKDNLTNRVFVAARGVGDETLQKAANLASGIGAVTERVAFYTGRTDMGETFIDNAVRTTVRNNALYLLENGGVTLLPDSERVRIESLPSDLLVEELNQHRYLYMPYHMVLDYSDPVFETRAYWLGNLKEAYRNHVTSNHELGFIVTSKSVDIALDDDRYVVTVTTEHPKGLTNLQLQLTYLSDTGTRLGLTLPATPVTETESRFTFALASRLDIDRNNTIDLTMQDNAGMETVVRCPITAIFDMVYVIDTGVDGTSTFDSRVLRGQFANPVTPITYEQTALSLAVHVDGLFLKSRPLVRPPVYKKHLVDVPDVYLEDEYKTDATGKVFEVLPDGTIEFIKLHSKGEQKVKDGELQWIARAGYPIVGADGQYLVESPSDYLREVRMPMFDARFRYATDPRIVSYRKSVPEQILDYLEREISTYRKATLEETHLYFEPLNTAQMALVRLGAGRETSVNTALKFYVEYKVTEEGYRDDAFRDSIIQKTLEIITEELKSRTFSLSALVKKLDDLGGDNIQNVRVPNPLPGDGLAIILDDSAAFSIGSRMRLQTNGITSVVNDVDVVFVK